MLLPQGSTVAVVDGQKLKLFHNTGHDSAGVTLKELPAVHPHEKSSGDGGSHHNSSANPSDSQASEDNFAAGVADMLNTQVQSGEIKHLVLIAAPKTLGELRKHYSKQVSGILLNEIAKELVDHPVSEIEKLITAA